MNSVMKDIESNFIATLVAQFNLATEMERWSLRAYYLEAMNLFSLLEIAHYSFEIKKTHKQFHQEIRSNF